MSVISKLHIENVKRILNVTIEPDQNSPLVVVGGMNGNGKSSVLDSISYLFGGEKLIPSQPIRRGAKSASIEAELTPDNNGVVLVLRRKFTQSGSTLEVSQKSVQGVAKLQSPQAVLNSLYSRVAFDPEAFRGQKPTERMEILKRLAGLDTSQIDAEIEAKFAERANAARDAKALRAKVGGVPHAGVPEQEISTSEMMKPIFQAQEIEKRRAELQGEERRFRESATELDREIFSAKEEIQRLSRLIEKKREMAEQARAKSNEALRMIQNLPQPQASANDLKRALAEANETNRKIRENQAHQRASDAAMAAELAYDAIDDELNNLRKKKESLIQNASWPIRGLGVDGNAVTWNGLPYEQASDSEQLKIATAIGFAMNPEVRVCLVRHGSLLDPLALEIIESVAREYSGQVFVERVSEGGECTVIMREGEAVDVSHGDGHNKIVLREGESIDISGGGTRCTITNPTK